MALRPIVLLSLLTFALLAGCSDGPAKGDLVPLGGPLTIDGTAENDYTAGVYPTQNPVPGQGPICVDARPETACTDPASNYTFHFMSLPEPSGEGYAIFQVGGEIGERSLITLAPGATGMWEAKAAKEGVDESTLFDHFELRMGDFVVAKASSAEGSQAFVAEPTLSAVTVTGSYKGNKLDLDVQGFPEGTEFVGRFYTLGLSGNLTVAESFPLVAGAQTLVTENAPVGDYQEFHIHVGTSKIYVYQATIE